MSERSRRRRRTVLVDDDSPHHRPAGPFGSVRITRRPSVLVLAVLLGFVAGSILVGVQLGRSGSGDGSDGSGSLRFDNAAADPSVLFGDDFEDGEESGWTKSGGTWSVTPDGSRVFRQANTTSILARQFAGSTSWADTDVSLRVKPTAVASSGLVGVAARASSNTSFVRLVVVGGGRVELQAVASGRLTVVGASALPVPTAWTQLRLVVVGTRADGYVDGRLVASGSVPVGSGRIGLLTSLASASFDDVVVRTPGGTPTTTPAPTTSSASPPPRPATSAPTTSTPTTSTPTTAAPTTPVPTAAAPTTAAPTTPVTGAWPTPTSSVRTTSTIQVTGTFDGGMRRYYGIGDGDQNESQPPMFQVADGGVVQNVVIGAPAGDGIHCLGACTIRNVWWEDVGEDAATFKGTSASQTMTIDGGGARHAKDKVFQHNGPGTMIIQNFVVEDFGKLYRSCGNCSKQYQRAVIVRNVTVTAPGLALVGINTNYGDSATISGITIVGDASRKIGICERYTGNSTGSEPTKTGSGPDGTYCRYAASDVTYR